MYGWMGKILQVNLSNARITRFPTQPYAERFLGGRGIGMRLYWEAVKPETQAFEPDNRLIFMTGPLVGTGAQGATQLSVVGKSPMTYPEGYCYGSLGGHVGAELKKAGFDGIVIDGRSDKPVYLWIHDGEAELRDASALWGQNAFHSGEMLQKYHGEKSRFITIGAAAERMVRTATALASNRSTLAAGFGAVLGSKNLKGIAILGTGKIQAADPGKLQELVKLNLQIARGTNYSLPSHRVLANADQSFSLERFTKGGCYLCGMECLKGMYRYNGQLEGYRKCQSFDYYLPWNYGRKAEPLETVFQPPDLVDDYSLESWELMSITNWLFAGYKAGLITEEETGLPLSKIGTLEYIQKLIHAIAYREGYGNILAEGLARLREKLPADLQALYPYDFAPIQLTDFNPPRAFFMNAILYAQEPRVHHIYLHEVAFINAAWNINLAVPGSTPVTTRVVHDVAKAFWGSAEAGDFSTYEGKALAAQKISNRTYLKESLGLCDFAYPITFSKNTPDHVGDPDLGSKMYQAVTGHDGSELDKYAERIANIQRLILLREGKKVPESDYPPEYNFTEPLLRMHMVQGTMIPGPSDEAVSFKGNRLDRNKFKNMLQEYYRLRGWDEETGRPLITTLDKLDLLAEIKEHKGSNYYE